MRSIRQNLPILNAKGAALLQIVFVGALLALTSYLFATFFYHADNEAIRVLRRNDNLNNAQEIADFINDRVQVKSSANVLSKNGAGTVIQYP